MLLSVCWIIYMAFRYLMHCKGFADSMLYCDMTGRGQILEPYSVVAAAFFGPPAVILALGLAVGWVVRGFSRRSN